MHKPGTVRNHMLIINKCLFNKAIKIFSELFYLLRVFFSHTFGPFLGVRNVHLPKAIFNHLNLDQNTMCVCVCKCLDVCMQSLRSIAFMASTLLHCARLYSTRYQINLYKVCQVHPFVLLQRKRLVFVWYFNLHICGCTL